MSTLRQYLSDFINCHKGTINLVLHALGLSLVAYGVLEKNVWFVVLGALIQEAGHIYQYTKSKKKTESPFFCLRSQSVFVYPIFVLIIAYCLWG